MRISISTEVLEKHNLTLGEFLVMLMGFYNINYVETYDKLRNSNLIGANIFAKYGIIMSENSKKLVERILTESDARLSTCGISDFEGLAKKLQELYPEGIKPGKTYSWRGTTEDIAQKLRALIVLHDFAFTEEEAIKAVKDYISSFEDQKYMSLLPFFILKTYDDGEIESPFMTIIENNRENRI